MIKASFDDLNKIFPSAVNVLVTSAAVSENWEQRGWNI